jgi:hypothetical protein
MRPIKVIDESSRYLISIADSIYRLGNQFSVDKNDRYLLEQYADELMGIQKKLESIKNNWLMKQQMEKELIEKEIEEDMKKRNEDKIKEKI